MDSIILSWIRDADLNKYSPITQVYGICFNKNNEILIIKDPDKDKWQLPGGHPEKGESGEDTLKRELLEEATVEVKNAKPLGVIKVIYPNNPDKTEGEEFYQARYVCELKELLPQTVDPDNGVLYDRGFVPMNEITEWIRWGESGDQMFTDAIKQLTRV